MKLIILEDIKHNLNLINIKINNDKTKYELLNNDLILEKKS